MTVSGTSSCNGYAYVSNDSGDQISPEPTIDELLEQMGSVPVSISNWMDQIVDKEKAAFDLTIESKPALQYWTVFDRSNTVLCKTFRETLVLDSGEKVVYAQARKILDSLCPSKELFHFVEDSPLTGSVAASLLFDIAQRQLALDPVLLRSLLLMLPLTTSAMYCRELLRCGGYPAFIRQVVQFDQPNFPPTAHTTCCVVSNTQGSIAHDPAFTKKARIELPQRDAKSEADRQFRFYANRVLQAHLEEYPEATLATDSWLADFISQASNVCLDDGLQLDDALKQAGLTVEFQDPSLFLFMEGRWEPEERGVFGLQRAILYARSQIGRQCQLCRLPSVDIIDLIVNIRLAVHSSELRRVFSDVRTTDELTMVEGMVVEKAVRLASLAIVSQKTARVQMRCSYSREGVLLWRFSVRPSLSTTLATFIWSRPNKIEMKEMLLHGPERVARLLGKVYVYAIGREAKEARGEVRQLKRKLLMAGYAGEKAKAALLVRELKRATDNLEYQQSLLIRETDIAMKAGQEIAVATTTVPKSRCLSMLKAVASECLDATIEAIDFSRMLLSGRLMIAHDVCASVSHLHQRGIMHLNLTTRNIFVKDGGIRKVRLGNFDKAKPIVDLTYLTCRETTYCPPEMKDVSPESKLRATPSIDSWSLGFVLGKIFAGPVFLQVLDNEGLPPNPEILQAFTSTIEPPHVRTVIQGLLTFQAQERWTPHKAACELQASLIEEVSRGVPLSSPPVKRHRGAT